MNYNNFIMQISLICLFSWDDERRIFSSSPTESVLVALLSSLSVSSLKNQSSLSVSSGGTDVSGPTSLSALWTLAAVSATTSSSSDSSESVVPPKRFLALCSRRCSLDSSSYDCPAAMYTWTGDRTNTPEWPGGRRHTADSQREQGCVPNTNWFNHQLITQQLLFVSLDIIIS